jgi:hypothetical protein
MKGLSQPDLTEWARADDRWCRDRPCTSLLKGQAAPLARDPAGARSDQADGGAGYMKRARSDCCRPSLDRGRTRPQRGGEDRGLLGICQAGEEVSGLQFKNLSLARSVKGELGINLSGRFTLCCQVRIFGTAVSATGPFSRHLPFRRAGLALGFW